MTYLGLKTPLKAFFPPNVTYLFPQFGMQDYVLSVLSRRDNITDSFIGRKNNVQAFVGSKMTYYFALAPTPSPQYLSQVQESIINYVWASGQHYVQVNLLYRPFDAGGLNLYSLARHNTFEIESI